MINLSFERSILIANPFFPLLFSMLRISLLKELNTSFLFGKEAFEARRVKRGPNIFFRNRLMIQLMVHGSWVRILILKEPADNRKLFKFFSFYYHNKPKIDEQ